MDIFENTFKVGDIVSVSGYKDEQFEVKGLDLMYSFFDGKISKEVLYMLINTKTGERIDGYEEDMTLITRSGEMVKKHKKNRTEEEIRQDNLNEKFDSYNESKELDLFLNSIFKTPQVTEYADKMKKIMKEIKQEYGVEEVEVKEAVEKKPKKVTKSKEANPKEVKPKEVKPKATKPKKAETKPKESKSKKTEEKEKEN